MHDESEPSPESRPNPLPDTLRNWQVLEIDSQATPVPEPARTEPTSRPEDVSDLQIGDRQDDVIVASLDNRRRQVECGATAEYSVSVLNNGPQSALFQVQIEGWIDPQWMGDAALSLTLEPGQRGTVRLPLSPPRRAASEAGDYHFAVTVRSPHYLGRLARVGALLTVLPFDAVEMRFLELADVAVSWLRRDAALPLSLTNLGNRPAQITLHGVDPHQECQFAFGPPGEGGVPALTLQPNQTVTFPVRVEVRRPPLAGLRGREVPVRVEARIKGKAVAGAVTRLFAHPLIGPWQMAASMGLAAAGAIGLLLVMALVFLLAQRSMVQQAPTAAPVVAAPPPVIIVTLNQPANSAPPAALSSVPYAIPDGASDFSAGAAPDPSLPLVLPDQVSAPDGTPPQAAPAIAASSSSSPGTVASGPVADPVTGPAANSSDQTYGEMFQTVGRQFDLDWRLLAAQAYVESGFDSLALSDAGAMGLMQVLPDTWREWSPAVDVSDPFDAYSSVLVAGAYLNYLRSELAAQGYPETEWMLVAYNWGPARLNDFLAGGGTWDSLPEVRRQYASEILRIAQSIP